MACFRQDFSAGAPPRTVRVPEDTASITDAIKSVASGGVVLVAPGTYFENVRLPGKPLTLASLYHTTGDESYIERTVIDGGGKTVIRVEKPGKGCKIVGFTIQDGEDGILAHGYAEITHCRIVNNNDGLDYDSDAGFGGGTVSNNVFEDNQDDGIDLDASTEATIVSNIIRNNRDDGIEIRLHKYLGETLTIVIEDNMIIGNEGDGIQIIDYPDVSNRLIRIKRNIIADNRMAGIGFMSDGDTNEDYRAAQIPESVYVINNTFVGNNYGLTGGGNLAAINNIFADTMNIAMKRAATDSISAYNLFWNNATNHVNSNVDLDTTLTEDPELDVNYTPSAISPALDAGTANYLWNGEVVIALDPDDYEGNAPDLGAVERE